MTFYDDEARTVKFAASLLILMGIHVVEAQEAPSRISPLPQQGSLSRERVGFRLTPGICRHILVRTNARGDVKFRANVDAEGKPLVPVDLNSYERIIPDQVILPIWFDLSRYSDRGMLDPSASARHRDKGSALVAELLIKKSGEIYLNDQPLFDEDEAMLRSACQQLEEQKSGETSTP
ncbi:MAG: hypothetical protein ACK5O7_01890 [Holosporales bacterium]